LLENVKAFLDVVSLITELQNTRIPTGQTFVFSSLLLRDIFLLERKSDPMQLVQTPLV